MSWADDQTAQLKARMVTVADKIAAAKGQLDAAQAEKRDLQSQLDDLASFRQWKQTQP